LNIFKIPSGEITNLPYLRRIGKLNKDVILSTGMADIGEIENALDVLVESGTEKNKITVLHATTEYPTPMEDVNLKAMLTIGRTFDIAYGYSDHTPGIEIPIAAAALGASVIEKHFTLDKTMEGPDHKASLEPDELAAMIKAIRNIETALGDGIKKPSRSELKNKPVARKSIVAARDIIKGEILSDENITVKRPGTGISPMRWDEVSGSIAQRDYKEDELIGSGFMV
jgi:N,N'-diacetyllegionaminate synthase